MEYSKLILGDKMKASGKVTWHSPSNLAIVKYWGKYGNQIPRNASVSLTLTNAITKTSIEYDRRESYDGRIDLSFYFEGKENQKFKDRIQNYLWSIKEYVPFIEQLHFKIRSENTFPHSSGIASSASSMSAIALCLCSIEQRTFGTLEDLREYERKASFLARLGSGSACRSIFDSWAVWGPTGDIEQSSNDFAVGIKDQVHPKFLSLHDDIFILSSKEKSVSSSAGHSLMDSNPYADIRYNEAKRQMIQVIQALRTGDMERLGSIAEQEAMSLHALMMVSNPSYILMEAETITMINKIRDYRKQTGIPVYFSLDAGPNIHLLYLDEHKDALSTFIETELRPLCVDNVVIKDQVGLGPIQID